MSTVLDSVQSLPPWLLLLVVFAVPASEAALFFGMFLPGETVIVLAGFSAHLGVVPLWSVIVVAILGAVAGDHVGYALGRKHGRALIDRFPGVARRSGGVDRALALIEHRGALAVFFGRWAALFRALVPSLAGMSGMARGRFTIANLAGGALWVTAASLLGYLFGSSVESVIRRADIAVEIGLVVIIVLVVAFLVVRHLRSAARTRA